jgi:amino acid transporter
MALSRFRRDGDAAEAPPAGGIATRESDEAQFADERAAEARTDTTRVAPAGRRAGGVGAWRGTAATSARDAELRRRDEFGGMNVGAAFFGWLVAVGMAVILTAIVAAAGTAIGLTNGAPDAGSADTVSIVGGALLVAILALAYFCGGYVAGRMSRFDGGRQGFGTWLIGLVVTLLLAGAGAVFGSKYNVFEKLNLPRIPIDEGSLATGGAIALAAILLGTLLAAILGGKAGQRYHVRVDRAGVADY